MRALLAGLITATLIVLPRSTRAQTGAIAGAGTIVGTVVAAETGGRLSYSTVTATPGGRERFTTDSGTFRFAGLAPGRVHLRVRHLGFAPLDTSVDVAAGQTTSIRVALTHLALALPTVEVAAERSCPRPGAPDPSADAALAAIFGQLEQNAERYELLLREYPFSATYEITDAVRRRDTLEASVAGKDARVDSDKRWQYAPGSVLTTNTRIQTFVHDPTLDVFVQPDFVRAHCYSYGGRAVVGGDTLLQVDFRVADRIHSPDFDGAMYLEPNTYVLRYSAFHLTALSSATGSADSSVTLTWFDELLPGVPFVADIVSTLYLKPQRAPRGRETADATQEERRRLAVQFQRDAPADAHIADVAPTLLPFSARPAPVRRLLGVFDQETGAPIAGVVVTDSITRRSAKTSPTGTVLLNFLSAAGGAVTLTRDGYTPVSVGVAVTPADTAPITMTMAATQAPAARATPVHSPVTTPATRHTTAPTRLAVSVRTADGTAIGNAEVSAVRGRDTVAATARTDSSGRATLTVALTPAAYDVVVRKLGFVRADRYVEMSAPPPDSQIVSVTLNPVAQQLAAVQVTAQESERRRRLYVDADAIAASTRPLLDGVDVIAKMRPDMVFGLGGKMLCPTASHLWVNDEEVHPEEVTMDEAAILHAQGNWATRSLPFFITSALAHIHPEHIADMHEDDCMNLSVGRHRENAISITLKPGVSYDPGRGSYVDTAKDSVRRG